MAETCGNTACKRYNGASLTLLRRHHKLRLEDTLYCCRDCLRWGLLEHLKTELARTRKSRVDLKRSRLGSLLLADGVITRDQLEVALKLQQWSPDKHLGQCLIELEYISPEQLTLYLSQQERVPFIRPGAAHPVREVNVNIPAAVARFARAVPYAYNLQTEELSLACLAPLDLDACAAIARMLECQPMPFLVQEEQFESFMKKLEARSAEQVMVDEKAVVLRNSVEILPLVDHLLQSLPLVDGCRVKAVMIRETIWVRVSTPAWGAHYLFSTLFQ